MQDPLDNYCESDCVCGHDKEDHVYYEGSCELCLCEVYYEKI